MLLPSHTLPPSFFDRPARQVARDLIGKNLVSALRAGVHSSMIVEAEAYEGPHDLACHAARGRTSRTEPMFGPPGTFYVYLVYGLHWMLNVVTGPIGYPAAVLIRGTTLAAGPGRLTAVLGIDGRLNGQSATPDTGLWFERAAPAVRQRISCSARIGVEYAGPVWSRRKLRFTQRST